MADLSLSDRSPRSHDVRTGQKRRAQSPASGDSHLHNTLMSSTSNVQHPEQEDQWQRNVLQLTSSRNNQSPRLDAVQVQNSVPTMASSGPSNSYASSSGFNYSNPGTAATSYSSDRFSPTSYSALPDASTSQSQAAGMQYGARQPGDRMNMAMHSIAPPIPQRKTNSGVLRAPGGWICNCCPKKPKKFESEEELR